MSMKPGDQPSYAPELVGELNKIDALSARVARLEKLFEAPPAPVTAFAETMWAEEAYRASFIAFIADLKAMEE